MSTHTILTYVGLTGLVLTALYTTYSQLTTFKARCLLPPVGASHKAAPGVAQETEDGSNSDVNLGSAGQLRLMREGMAAIKLETLQALALGVNPELRNAALKIITERSLRSGSLGLLLEWIENDDHELRLKGLKALKILATNSEAPRLLLPRVFTALVSSLRKSLALPTSIPSESRGEREAIATLARLIPFADAHKYAVQAGIIDWLKEYQVPGYPNVVVAVFDPERSEGRDTSAGGPGAFYELLNSLCEEGTVGRQAVLESGLVRDVRRTRSETEGMEWVEVAV